MADGQPILPDIAQMTRAQVEAELSAIEPLLWAAGARKEERRKRGEKFWLADGDADLYTRSLDLRRRHVELAPEEYEPEPEVEEIDTVPAFQSADDLRLDFWRDEQVLNAI